MTSTVSWHAKSWNSKLEVATREFIRGEMAIEHLVAPSERAIDEIPPAVMEDDAAIDAGEGALGECGAVGLAEQGRCGTRVGLDLG